MTRKGEVIHEEVSARHPEENLPWNLLQNERMTEDEEEWLCRQGVVFRTEW